MNDEVQYLAACVNAKVCKFAPLSYLEPLEMSGGFYLSWGL